MAAYFCTEYEILEAMIRYGGSFVKKLAELYRLADRENQQKLESTFRNYFEVRRHGKRYWREEVTEAQKRNQAAAREAIDDYLKIVTGVERQLLVHFTKFLAQRLLKRVEANDCYFVDLLEDLERLEE